MKRLKKPLTLVLALMMALGLLSVNAGAEWVEDQPDGAVVEWTKDDGAKQYNTEIPQRLEDGTYKLLDDASAGAILEKNSAVTHVTLDLNGKTLTTSDCIWMGYFTDGFELRIIDSSENGGGKIQANVATDNLAIASNKFRTGNYLYIGKGVTINSTGYGVWLVGTDSVADIYGEINAKYFAVSTNGNNKAEQMAKTTPANFSENITINVYNGAKLTATDSAAVYLPGSGSFNMTGGAVEGTDGIYNKSAYVNISGGTIKGTGAKLDYEYYGNGTKDTGNALVMDSCNYPNGAPSANITGGTFESVNAYAVSTYSYTATGATEAPLVTGFISGGTFKSASGLPAFLAATTKQGEATQDVTNRDDVTLFTGTLTLNANGEVVPASDSGEEVKDNATIRNFVLSLVKNDADTHFDGDNDSKDDYKVGETAIYDIQLALADSETLGENEKVYVNALNFDVDVTNLTVASVSIKGSSLGPTTTGGKTYAFDNRYNKDTNNNNADIPDIEVTKNAVTIGTITLTVGGTNNDTLTLKLKNATVKERIAKDASNVGDATATFEVDSKYTITVMKPPVNETTGVINPNAETWEKVKDIDYTVLTSQAITTDAITAYKFLNKFEAVQTTDGNWSTLWNKDTSGTTKPAATAAANSLYGNVTLKAQYEAIEYTATITLGDNVTFPTNEGPKPTENYTADTGAFKYTIETAKGGDAFGTPERKGYDFEGWNARRIGAGSEKWDAKPVTDTVKTWGNVTLTPVWSLKGEFVQVNYAYARSGNYLTLFAVKEKESSGVYTCNGQAMFIVDAANERYAPLFGKDGDANKVGTTEDKWTIFAYIAGATTKDAAIAYDPNGTAENVAIKYDGDVTRNNAINSGDFGNVSAMLADHDEYTYGTVGIQARLEADVVMNENEDTNHTWLGTIEDVMNIMNKAGTTVSGS